MHEEPMGITDKLPKGRLGRLARFAASGAKTGATLLLSKDSRKAALDSAQVLGQLRGLATKVGQMASYVDGLVPAEHRDAFENGMTKLQAAASESDPVEIRALVESELGHSIDDVFDNWEDKPIASASIGQVHRANLKDGTSVAVKVQHPGIAEALEADLRNAGLVEMAMSATMGTGKFESKRLVEEMRERFREELDYTLEAKSQNYFAAIHKDDPFIKIPIIFDEFSSHRVLTSEFIEGKTFIEARASSEEDRRLWAATLWRFVYRSLLVEGLFNADPHPGNYIFQPDGNVCFLDFGCIQPLGEERRKDATRLHKAAHEGDMESFKLYGSRMLETHGGDYAEMVYCYLQNCFKPIFESPFEITQDYSGDLVKEFKSMMMSLLKTRNDGFVPMPRGILFINRLQFGFYSVLARLNVEVDYAATELQYLQEAVDK